MSRKSDCYLGLGVVVEGQLVAGCAPLPELQGWDTIDDLMRDVVKALAAFIAYHCEDRIVSEVALHFTGVPVALIDAISKYLPSDRDAAREIAESFKLYAMAVDRRANGKGRTRGKK